MQFNLFATNPVERNPQILLPGADLLYFEHFFDQAVSNRLLDYLVNNIAWKQDHMKIYGKLLPLPRLSAWYGDTHKPYSYSGITLQPIPWTSELLFIKEQIENLADTRFSSVLINRYRDGHDYVGWHTDAEKELGKNPIIASVNFGATRKFQLRRIDNHADKFELDLKHGTFLLMRGATQHFWQHQVPKTHIKVGERINLTFRCIL